MNPAIAVLMAVYNGSNYIRAQLDSILSQTYLSGVTILIHDDGSTDDTVDIIEDYQRRFPDIIRVDGGAPTGSAKDNFWYMLSLMDADIYFFCDQDDIWLPDKIEKSLDRLLNLKSDCRCVFCDMKVVDEALNIIDESFLHYNGRDPRVLKPGRILIDNPAAGTSMCFDRALRDLALSVDFDLNGIEMHDGFLLAMAALCGEVEFIDEPLVLYRQHADNDMGAARQESIIQRIIRNARSIISGSFFSDKKAFLKLSQSAAGELSRLDCLEESKRTILKTYASLSGLSPIKRILFLRKNGFDRARHTWWLYILFLQSKIDTQKGA